MDVNLHLDEAADSILSRLGPRPPTRSIVSVCRGRIDSPSICQQYFTTKLASGSLSNEVLTELNSGAIYLRVRIVAPCKFHCHCLRIKHYSPNECAVRRREVPETLKCLHWCSLE